MENYLFKFFSKEKYVHSFREGKIRMMSAYHYANFDGEVKKDICNNRYDATEGKSILINRKNAESPFVINFAGKTEVKLASGVESFLLNTAGASGQLKISCYYALQNNDFPSGKFKEALDTMEDSLGDYFIVFTNPAEFARRVQKEVDRLKAKCIVKDFGMKCVEYFDSDTFSGITTPFQKPAKLSWQREYRLLIETINERDPFILDIGDISDIALWGRIEDLYNGYVVDDVTMYIPNIQR